MATVEELTARVDGLEARLRAAEDVQAIQRLKARYAELVDARYARRGGVKPADEVARIADAIAALFTPDGVWDGGAALGTCTGRDAIAARMREPTLSFSWHYFLKPCIEVMGDTARGSWDILSPCTSADGRAMWMAGVERDEYARVDGVGGVGGVGGVDGAWLHTRMSLEVVFMAPHDRGWASARRREEPT